MVAEPDDFFPTLRQPLLFGRWLLFVTQVVESIFLLAWRPPTGQSNLAWQPHTPLSIVALTLLGIYTIVTLVVVYRVPMPRLNRAGLLALDFLFVAFAAYFTNSSRSPFLGQFYVLIFMAALFYGLAGGILAGIGAVLITIALAIGSPEGWGQDMRYLIPYFLITGAFSGYLVGSIKAWHFRYGKALTLEKEREVSESVRRHEMHLATRIQRAALPAKQPTVPGLDIATVSEFPLDVGGDFYLFLHEEHRLVLAVGDVSGKGIGAALTATSISYLLPWLHPLVDPAQAFRDLNQDLLNRLPMDAFVTLVLAEIDTERETVRVWSAGHPTAFLWCADCAEIIRSTASGSVLGILPQWDGTPWTADFHLGDTLLLYTDGLTEVRNHNREFFGEESVVGTLVTSAGQSASAIAQSIAEAAKSWGEVVDDLTILACRRPADSVDSTDCVPVGIDLQE